jgi:signal transduction histidine kinase
LPKRPHSGPSSGLAPLPPALRAAAGAPDRRRRAAKANGGGVIGGGLQAAADTRGLQLSAQKLAEGDGGLGRERSLLYSIINAVTDPILLTDTEGRLLIANARALTLFTASEEESEGRRSAVRMNNMLLSSTLSSKAIEKTGVARRELPLANPVDGSDLLFELLSTVTEDPRHGTGVVSILHNVSDLRRASVQIEQNYEQLKQASDELERRIQAATADAAQQNELLRRQTIELEQASQLKSQFLANMSHEFRTPLNAMLGYTSMLLQGVAGSLEPSARRQLGRIESNGRHLLMIINEILDISRIEAGRMPLQISTFRISDLLADVNAKLAPIIMRSTLSVTLDAAKDLKPISSDRQKVKQILLNLLSNALKFTHQGGVTMSARRHPSGRAVVLSVSDTGIGIAPQDQERIFEDFRQLDNSPTRAYGGTGLGLSSCRRLAQMLGGRIAVQSQVGRGSTFTLTLPIQGRR